MRYKKSGAGFTLIELLVVVAIIGLMAAVITVAFTSARVKTRNAVRKSDIAQLHKALALYYSASGQYPRNGTVGNPNNETDIQNLASFLVPTHISSIPDDPSSALQSYEYVWGAEGRAYGLYIPFSNDGGTDCKFVSAGGNQNWWGPLNQTPLCNYN